MTNLGLSGDGAMGNDPGGAMGAHQLTVEFESTIPSIGNGPGPNVTLAGRVHLGEE